MRLRRLLLAGSVGVAGFLACDEPFQPAPTHGSIAIVLVSGDSTDGIVAGRTRGRGAGPAWSRSGIGPRFDATGAADLDAARVIISGPTNKTEDLPRSGDFFESTVDSLLPGAYTVRVEGLVGGEVDHIGQTTATVTAGETAEATTPFESFVPTVDDFTASTTGFTITATFNTITAANNYIVEFANNAAFTGAAERTTSTGSAAYQAPDTGTYYVRARSSNASVQRGRPGAAKTVRIIREPSDTTDNAIRAQQLGFGSGGALPTQSSYNIYPTTDIDWFSIRVCAADSLDIVARAALLTPASALVPRVRVFDEAGTTQLREVVAAAGANGRLGYRVPAEANYKIQITAANNTVGHYELDVTVDRSVYNTGALPCIVPVDRVVLASDSLVLGRGTTQSVLATTLDGSGNDLGRPLTWTSRDPAIAMVDGTGAITGVQVGIVGVIAASEGKADTVGVRVTPGSFSTALSEVRVSGPSLASGSAATLTVMVRDDAGNAITTGGLTVTFANTGGTSTGTIGAVADNNNGTYTANFTGVLAGTATTIGASIGGNAITSTLPTIAVTPGPVATVVVAPDGGTLVSFGQSLQLGATVHDAAGNTPAVTVTWSTVAAGVVSVDGTGLVAALANGAASVIATAADKADTVAITVAQVVASVTVSPSSAELAGGSTNFSAQAFDARGNGMMTAFTWQSLNPAVVTATAGQVTAVASGQGTIVAVGGGVSGYALVTVAIPGATAVNAFVPQPTDFPSSVLTGLWGLTSTDVWAVGSAGLVLHYDGTSWTKQQTSLSPGLNAVWGASGLVVFAVGASDAIIRYDGTSWSPSPGALGGDLNGVWGTSPRDVFAVGSGGVIGHFDGGTWTTMTSNTTAALFGVWGTSSTSVFAVGAAGTIRHYNGVVWETQTSPVAEPLQSVWGTSSTDVYALSSSGSVIRYNGIVWTLFASLGGQLEAIWGTSNNDIYAAGAGGAIHRYDGNQWLPLATGTMQPLHAIWGTSSASSILAAGNAGTVIHGIRGLNSVVVSPPGATIYTAGGQAGFGAEARDASNNVIPNISFTFDVLNPSIAINVGGTVTAVGNGQTTIRARAGTFAGYALLTVAAPTQIPVGRWRPDISNTAELLRRVFAFSNTNVYAVGNNGTITHFDGADWTATQPLSTAQSLGAIWGAAPNDIWVMGSAGGIWHYDGNGWQPVNSPTSNQMVNMWGSAPNDIWAVGPNRTLLHYNGIDWTLVTNLPGTILATNALQGIWGSSSSDVFISGNLGVIAHFDGSSWTHQSTGGVGSFLSSIWGISSSVVLAAGQGGAVLSYNGVDSWSLLQPAFTTANLNRVWGAHIGDVGVFGNLINQPAQIVFFNGLGWTSVPTGTANNIAINGAMGMPSGDVFAVGTGGLILRGERGISSVALTPPSATLTAVNATAQFSAEARDINGNNLTGYAFSWMSTDPVVADVDANGVVTSQANGSASIIASVTTSAGLFADTSTVTVAAGFNGTVTPVGADFADTVIIRPGEIAWNGDEVATLAGRASWHVTGNADSLVVLVPSSPLGTQVLGVHNQGPDQLTQFANFDVFSAFTPNTPAAAPNIFPGVFPLELFISLEDAAATHYVRLMPSFDAAVRVTLDWQTGANLDIGWCNQDCSITLGNTDGATNATPEVSVVVIPNGEDWRLRLSKVDAGTEPTMAKVTIEIIPVGQSVTSGGAHSCALDAYGAAFCWGSNLNGQLGNGTRAYSTTPVPVSGGFRFQSIDAGNTHTCGVTTDGDIYCWGSNGSGHLGTGSTSMPDALTPVQVVNTGPFGAITFLTISAGISHTCATATSNETYCWGTNNNGQLGNGGTVPFGAPQLVSSGGVGFQSVSAGTVHTCAVSFGGTVYCWGGNSTGQLGIGSTDGNFHTTPEAVPSAEIFTTVSAGNGYSCASTGAAGYCWGSNSAGKLGINSFAPANVPSPTAVFGPPLSLINTSSGNHTCGLSAGAVYCWGLGASGQLGNNATGNTAAPVAILGGGTYQSVAAGGSHVCGGTSLGTVRCWGLGSSGQLGNGTAAPSSPVAVSGAGSGLVSIAVGLEHACGLNGAGAAYCWGVGISGQLGQGSFVSSTTPVAVSGGITFQPQSLTAGGSYTCGLEAVTGLAYCWGRNQRGQLGDSTRTARNAPVAAYGNRVFTTISSGISVGTSDHVCALEVGTGAVFCWGNNLQGELGTGITNPDSIAPVAVIGGRTFQHLSAGAAHNCAIESGTGATYCWGANNAGQLGDGTQTTPQPSPVPLSGSLSFASLKSGNIHTCGVTTGFVAYCWGDAANGKLGDGQNTTLRLTPTLVFGNLSMAEVRASIQHTCGVTTTGVGYCWGRNVSGQLGNGMQIDTTTVPFAVQGALTFVRIEGGNEHTCGVTASNGAYCWGQNSLGQVGDGTMSQSLTPVTVSSGAIFQSPPPMMITSPRPAPSQRPRIVPKAQTTRRVIPARALPAGQIRKAGSRQ